MMNDVIPCVLFLAPLVGVSLPLPPELCSSLGKVRAVSDKGRKQIITMCITT